MQISSPCRNRLSEEAVSNTVAGVADGFYCRSIHANPERRRIIGSNASEACAAADIEFPKMPRLARIHGAQNSINHRGTPMDADKKRKDLRREELLQKATNGTKEERWP